MGSAALSSFTMPHHPSRSPSPPFRVLGSSLASLLLAGGVLVACDEDVPEATDRPAETPEPELRTDEGEEPPDECVASAEAAIGALKMGLKTRLVEAMQDGVPAAVEVCANEAEAIRARVAEETGVRVGRTSTKVRNPANAEAPEWAKAYLEEPRRADGGFAAWVERTDTEAHVVSPLVAQGLCLTCHGETITPSTIATIDEHYPDDRARGFADGDLRGVVWAAATCER